MPGYRVAVVDTVGAGDAFAAGFLHGVASGWPLREIGDFANRLGALVAARPGGTPAWTPAEIESLSNAR
jgi:fructokinase